MDLVIFGLVAVLALGCFWLGATRKAVIPLLVSSGAFFVLGMLLMFQGLSVETGQKVLCLDANGSSSYSGVSCGDYGYSVEPVYTNYTKENNVPILLFAWLASLWSIVGLVEVGWLATRKKNKADVV